jgi:hypothetical protein
VRLPDITDATGKRGYARTWHRDINASRNIGLNFLFLLSNGFSQHVLRAPAKEVPTMVYRHYRHQPGTNGSRGKFIHVEEEEEEQGDGAEAAADITTA